LDDAQRREQSPAAEQARLSGREPHLLDRKKLTIVEDMPMDQDDLANAPQGCTPAL